MPDQEELAGQQDRLAGYRANLQHLLQQATDYGGERYAPLDVLIPIRQQREEMWASFLMTTRCSPRL